MHNPFLTGNKIYLRATETGDAELIARSENHPEPRQTLYYALPSSPQSIEERLLKLQDDPATILLTIVNKETDVPIGITSFVRIDWVGRMATFYIAIADSENWSKGFGGEATRMMIDYAFGTLNWNRVQLHVSTENEAAVRAYQKAGYQIEGTLRQAMFHENHYSDFYVMAILREDWAPRT
jgi:RimJ/RimL family protein N-acetyltransferase